MIQLIKRKSFKTSCKLFLVLVLISSCKTIAPLTPELVVGKYIAPIQKVSTINIPIEMEMNTYFRDADMAVPYDFVGESQRCDDVSYAYKFTRNPIKIEGNGKKSNPLELGIQIDGQYALNLNYCPKCTDLFSDKPNCLTPRIYASCGVGEPMRKITVEYKTLIDLKPNFSLDANTSLKEITPKDKCQITVFSYDATSQVIKEVKSALKDVGKEIDRGIEDLKIKQEINSIWGSLTTPFAIQGYGYLYLKPEKIGVNNLRLNGSRLQFEASIEAFPLMSLTRNQTTTKVLPDLSPIKSEDGFNINLDLHANYDSLSEILNKELSGKVIQIKRNKIILDSAKVHGAANQQLSIEVSFSGSKRGKLYFLGTPVFNDSLQEISFPDLSFELQTKNALLKSAKWLFNDKITNIMRSYSKFNMTKILDDARKKIEEQLNVKMEPNIFLTGKMYHAKVKNIFPDAEKLIIQTNLKGNLNVVIK